MKKKNWMKMLLAFCIGASTLALSSCFFQTEKEPTQIEKIYAQYVVYAQAEGQEPLSYEEWLAFIKGEKGDKGDKGDPGVGIEEIYIDENGHLIVKLTGQEPQDLGQVVFKDDTAGGGSGSDENEFPPQANAQLTVAQAYAYAETFVGGNNHSTDKYYVTGTIQEIKDDYYGNMTIADDSGATLYVYGTWDATGANRYGDMANAPKVGDTVKLYGILGAYYETVQMKNGWIVAVNGGSSGGGGNQGGTVGADFTADEKALFNEYFGFVIPFVASNEYYVEEYSYYYEDTDETEVGVNFYAYDLTTAQFSAYKALYSSANGYTNDGTDEDEYGDTWYYYSKNDHYIDLCYYETNDGYVLDVYVYDLYEGDVSGNGGGSSGGSGSGSTEDVDLITNAGKGLPTGQNGVYNVDFTKATYVKNVTEQGYYIDGCPTVGSPKVLVIPVEFSDVTAASKGYQISKIETAFKGGAGTSDYHSVHDYYYQSSYGQLDLDIVVLDSWFRPEKTSDYYKTATIDYYGDEMEAGEQLVMNEALAYLSQTMDLSQFDSDNNTCIDAVVLITTLEIDSESTFNWAFRYWNVYTDDDGYYYEYDGVSANDYLWASYQFMLETYNEDGEVEYDSNIMNTYTYIHEFGHVLGADDYYDTSYTNEDDNSPMAGCDIMDSLLGDHNAYSKFNYGWLTNSRLVVAESTVTLTLEDFTENGDTIIIANNWDETLGVYQEYYILAYYTANGLNAGEDAGYFSRDGVVVYHVDASLYKEEYDGEAYYDVYNNNTDGSDEYGTVNNLIEYVKSANDTFTYIAGDTILANTKDNQGNKIAYTFTVDSLTSDTATITFTKNA